ncbi:xanthine dehydrogenase family protein subunit M [Paraburkholderia sp. SARCC-3016]|uniref:FAD binding domain-containing protein n=1 Tax=Paraburkholderia sp. SARCC-3016 TaxID=3058611 RepID=UPI002809B7B3|nr:xanthine dehydrogenase family protein subunit M [Paraburkholderia sp. SARCC-3016]MDQ7982293.1 xanthine dehydrogenase family protein subunit M [Paraburkholderia sp. SARCC-3016]
MEPFEYRRAASGKEALALASRGGAQFLAGGTELINWMRIGIERPATLIDITRIDGLSHITTLPNGGLSIGALNRLNDVAQHALVAQRYPVLSQAILKAASAQIRNLATIGGNPLQRVRCPYFRADEPTPCNRRSPGSGCAALHGFNEKHAIFGWTDDCVAVQPSDPAVALAALDAAYVVRGISGVRRIPARDFHVLPGEDPSAHHRLRPGELMVAMEIPRHWPRSAYLKIRERESYEYATASVAVALDLDGDVIRRARIALGSVAMKPWRLDETERRLAGVRIGSPEMDAAINAGFGDARALSRNAYKIQLARNAVARAIDQAAEA